MVLLNQGSLCIEVNDAGVVGLVSDGAAVFMVLKQQPGP